MGDPLRIRWTCSPAGDLRVARHVANPARSPGIPRASLPPCRRALARSAATITSAPSTPAVSARGSDSTRSTSQTRTDCALSTTGSAPKSPRSSHQPYQETYAPARTSNAPETRLTSGPALRSRATNVPCAPATATVTAPTTIPIPSVYETKATIPAIVPAERKVGVSATRNGPSVHESDAVA